MKVGRLVRAARKRKGFTQRELSATTRIPQPMISLIERGLQDPRYSTLQRIFHACDLSIDIVNVAGGGIDRTQFSATLPLTPEERLRRSLVATRAINELVRNARRVR
jgi:transcriptional regulator with XRE-family HTH domain